MMCVRYRRYLEKSKALLGEAERDFQAGCYNKTVSAAWFTVETLLRAIVLYKGRPMPEQPSKLMSIIHRIILEEYPHVKHLIPMMSSLYEKRKRADHRETLFNRDHARRALEQAKHIYSELISMLTPHL